MSLVDRLNPRLFARLSRNAPRLSVEDDALRMTESDGAERRIPLAELVRAMVLHRDVYATDAILLRLEWSDGTCVEVFQDDPHCAALVTALDRTGRLATPSLLWQVQAIADGPNASPRELM